MELSQVCIPGVTWSSFRYIHHGSLIALLGMYTRSELHGALRYVHHGSHGALSGMYTMGHL